jgi:integrase
MTVIRMTEERVRLLPLGSGIWRDEVVKGLLCICHKTTRSYAVQGDVRRNGRHVRTVRKVIDRCDRVGLAEARRRAKGLMSEIQSGTDISARPPETGITLQQALDAHLQERELRPATVVNYTDHLDRYLARFRRRAVADISRQDVRDILDEVTRRCGRTSAANALRTLRAIINTARRMDETIGPNPVDAVRVPVPSKRRVAELDVRIWWGKTAVLSPCMRDLQRAFILTGARRASMLRVRREDVDLDRRVLRFTHMKTSDEPLLFPMGPWLAATLRARMEEDAPLRSEWLWPSPGAKDGHLVEPKRYGLPGPHALRHQMRTTLVKVGCPMLEGSLLVGHALPGMASTYVHAEHLVENLRPWVERLEAHVLAEAGEARTFESFSE